MHERYLKPEAARGNDRRRGRVTSDYRAAYADPLSMHAGQELAVQERESEWPGWVWCLTAEGKSGWVPETYLEQQGAIALALCDYDAVELSVHSGEELILGPEVSGWVWCTNQSGQSGWVPDEHLSLG